MQWLIYKKESCDVTKLILEVTVCILKYEQQNKTGLNVSLNEKKVTYAIYTLSW